ncbi:MAG: YceI family protein [Thermodesulfobacteriota bacterium]
MRRKSFATVILSAALIVSFFPRAAFSAQDETATALKGSLTPDIFGSGEVMEFEVISGKSTVEFIGTSLMHHFEGISHEPSGFTRVNFSDPRTTTVTTITVLVNSLKGIALGLEKSDLSKNIHQNLESDKYPDITFKMTQIMPEKADTSDPSKRGYLLKGDLKIHNMTKTIVVTANTDIKDGFLHVTGEYDNLNMTDYGVEPKPLMAFIRVNDIVDIKFDLYEGMKKGAPVQ